ATGGVFSGRSNNATRGLGGAGRRRPRFSTSVEVPVDNSDRADPSAAEDITDEVAEELWDAGATALRTQLAEATWHAWFQSVRAVRLEGDILVLAVPSTVACERIRSSYGGLLDDTLRDTTGREIHVELLVDTRDKPEEITVSDDPPAAMPLPETVAPPRSEGAWA